jgi:hypothetical protein
MSQSVCLAGELAHHSPPFLPLHLCLKIEGEAERKPSDVHNIFFLFSGKEIEAKRGNMFVVSRDS